MAFLPTFPLPPWTRPRSTRTSRRRTSHPTPRTSPRSSASYPPPYPDNGFTSASPNGTSETTDTSTPDNTPVFDATTRPVPPADLKYELYSAAASANRGLAATPDLRERILSLVAELERASPSSAPADNAPLLTGRWRLLFTDALDVLSLALLAPVALVGQVYQNIYEPKAEDRKGYEFDVDNVVQLHPPFAPVADAFFGQTMATLTVSAQGKRVSESRIDITFVSTALRQDKFVGFDVPLELPPLSMDFLSRVGYIETTFLDEELRVARSPPYAGRTDGFVFVLLREQ